MKQDYINAVNDHLLFETEPQKTDIAILLGARSVSGEIARTAVKGLAKGDFSKVVLCGGNKVFEPWIHGILKYKKINGIVANDFWSRSKEADYMRTVLVDAGVSPTDIVYSENKSKQTGENFEKIRDFMASQNFASASIITTAYHQRRAVETCKVWLPELKTTPVSVYPYGLSRDVWMKEWAKTPLIKSVVAGEFEKLNLENPNNYYKKGFCVPVVL